MSARRQLGRLGRRSMLRYLRPLRRDPQKLKLPCRNYRRKVLYGSPLWADVRALRAWRGTRPRVAIRNYLNHPLWSTLPEVRNARLRAIYARALER